MLGADYPLSRRQDLQVANKKLRDEVEVGSLCCLRALSRRLWWQELENKITQIEKHEAERREQEERKHKEEACCWRSFEIAILLQPFGQVESLKKLNAQRKDACNRLSKPELLPDRSQVSSQQL